MQAQDWESNTWGDGHAGSGEQPHVALTGLVPHTHCCWLLHTQSHLPLSNRWSVERHLALESATHWQRLLSHLRPQPQNVWAEHLH